MASALKIIVGHGASLLGKGLGRFIDSNTVIRPNKTGLEYTEKFPKDYGSATDILFDRQKADLKDWEARYESLQPSNKKLSSGTLAVIWALRKYRQPILIVGFDNVVAGSQENYTHPGDIPKTRQRWEHDALRERQLIRMVSQEYWPVFVVGEL